MRRPLLFALAAIAALLATAHPARASYGLHPNGETTTNKPTFTVYLDPPEVSLATVYVASDTAMSSSYQPAHQLASCYSFTPTSDANVYSCTPTIYAPNYTASLPPGHYVWWLTYYHRDPGQFVSTLKISGPLDFTVPEPQAPANVYLSSPADGASVGLTPTMSVHLPAGLHLDTYVADSADRNAATGSPVGVSEAHCSGDITSEGDYTCKVDPYMLTAGHTYYWWAVVTSGDYFWIYGPRSFVAHNPSSGGSAGGSSGSSGSGSSGATAHAVTYAPYLTSSDHYGGKSIKQAKLGRAAYTLSKMIGVPKTVAVACWSSFDWANISGDNPESAYSTLGFFMPSMPHWIQLSPGICHTMETLIYHRPQYTNRITANAVDTLTHEMLHALGVHSEALAECFSMQLTYYTAYALGMPDRYAANLGRLTWSNYGLHPSAYVNRFNCREDGAWDLFKHQPSLPWHMP